MSDPTLPPGKPLDPSVTKALQEAMDTIRMVLLSKAQANSNGEKITEDDLHLAYKSLDYPSKESVQFSDVQTVISQALSENRVIEWVSYSMAVILFLFGLGLLLSAALVTDIATRVGCLVSGSLVELLILIPFRFAINSRRHNIALRMVGLIISRVDDPKKLAPLLKDTFLAVVMGNPQFNVTSKQ